MFSKENISLKSSAAWDSILVGSFFGFSAGILAFSIVILWTILTRSTQGWTLVKLSIALHALYIVLYVLSGIVIASLWPTQRTIFGRWGLWFLATATGAFSVNSVAYGPPWAWSSLEWHTTASYLFFSRRFSLGSAWILDRIPKEISKRRMSVARSATHPCRKLIPWVGRQMSRSGTV